MKTSHFLFVVLAGICWGTGGVLGVLLSEHSDLHPLSVAMWRMLIAGVALLLLLALTGELRLRSYTRQAWMRALLTGGLTAIFEAMYFTGISMSSVGLATLVAIGSAPVFVALYDWLFRRERPAARTLIALALALAGLVTLLSGSLETGSNGLLGALLAMTCGLAFAIITVINRTPVPGFEPVPLTGIAFAAGGLMLVPVAAFAGIDAPKGVGGWGFAVAVGVIATALAYVAYLTGLKTVPPFVATIVILLEPLIATVLGIVVLDEALGLGVIVGGVALAAAVVLLRPQRDEPETIH